MPSPIILITGRDGRITHVNAPGRDMLGDVSGLDCCDVLGHDSRACPARKVETMGHIDLGMGRIRGLVGPLSASWMGDQLVIIFQPRGIATDRPPRLSTRETEVLRLVSKGLTDARIAGELGLHPGTVRTHVENIREKLSVHTRSQAVARALSLGLLD